MPLIQITVAKLKEWLSSMPDDGIVNVSSSETEWTDRADYIIVGFKGGSPAKYLQTYQTVGNCWGCKKEIDASGGYCYECFVARDKQERQDEAALQLGRKILRERD